MKVTRFARFVVLLNCGAPAILLGWDALRGDLGANPVNFAIRTTGMLSLIFLMLTLLITPVSRLTGWSWLTPFRRVLGLYAFFHASLHFLIFFWFDREASVDGTILEILVRPYLMVGAAGLLLMVPLAATSANFMIRLLGAARWKALHRLAYLIAIAGVTHYYMLVKADVTKPVAFAVVLAVLLGYRLIAHYLRLRSAYDTLQASPAFAVAPAPAPAPAPALATTPLAVGSGPRFWSGQMRVARIFEETSLVRTFRLAPVDGKALPFDFLPGQYLNLSLTVDGKKVNRSYTIASSPTRGGYCELTVKREKGGIASRHLHDAVNEGSLLDVSAPAGRFTFTGAEADSIVMIAGGVGITPLMAKVRYLTDLSWPGEIYLVYSVRTEHDIIFREELDYLQRRFPNLKVVVTLTRADGTSWSGERGRISAERLRGIVPRIARRRVHVCGPTAMNDLAIACLREVGVADDAIRLESFTSPGRFDQTPLLTALDQGRNTATPMPADLSGPASTAATAAATVTFASSGKSMIVSAVKTVLEASEDLGVNIGYDCRAGICGQCKTRLIAGHVTMNVQDALDLVDRANNVILSCRARCVDHVVVEA